MHTAIGAPSETEGSLATFKVLALHLMAEQHANVIDSSEVPIETLIGNTGTLHQITPVSEHYVTLLLF